MYFQDQQQKRVGELHFVKNPWEVRTLDDMFKPYATKIKEQYKS